jgi:hypothetical protein
MQWLPRASIANHYYSFFSSSHDNWSGDIYFYKKERDYTIFWSCNYDFILIFNFVILLIYFENEAIVWSSPLTPLVKKQNSWLKNKRKNHNCMVGEE